MDHSFSIFVRDLQSRTVCLSVNSSAHLQDLRASVQEATGIPQCEQLLVGRHVLNEGACLAEQGLEPDSTLHLLGRLRGGKGGFGSLLRGSGKAALTENEDACRDLSGRRLRLVNADKKLKDWAAAEKLRTEEKKAAKDERDRVKSELRAEEAQENLDVIRKEQSAVVANVAKALESSRKNGVKRNIIDSKVSKPATKKTRYSSDSEEESDSDDEEEEEEEKGGSQTEATAGKNSGEDGLVERTEFISAVKTPGGATAAVQISLAT